MDLSAIVDLPPSEQIEKLKELIVINDEHAEVTYSVIVQFCHALGIVDDDGVIKPEIKEGGSSMMAALMKSVGNLTTDMMMSKSPFSKLSKKKPIEERFAFFAKIEPMLQYYSQRFDAKKYINK